MGFDFCMLLPAGNASATKSHNRTDRGIEVCDVLER